MVYVDALTKKGIRRLIGCHVAVPPQLRARAVLRAYY